MAFDALTILGVIGSTTVIAAYFANQQGWWSSKDWRYSIANLIGALLILISLFVDWNLAAAVIEGFWATISIYGLTRQLIWPHASQDTARSLK